MSVPIVAMEMPWPISQRRKRLPVSFITSRMAARRSGGERRAHDVDIGIGVCREIDAEEEHDEPRAEQPDDGDRNRGRARGDAPWAQEFADDVDEVDVLEDGSLIGEARKLLGEARGAGSEAARELGDLLGERGSRGGEHDHEEEAPSTAPPPPASCSRGSLVSSASALLAP